MNKGKEIIESIPIYIDKIDHICEKYNISTEDLVNELVRFLDLIHLTSKTLSPSNIVDLAWHELILFTRFYEKFCKKHYSRFIHHTPSKTERPSIYLNTMQLYIKEFGQPHPVIWGNIGQEEWELNNCGSCLN